MAASTVTYDPRLSPAGGALAGFVAPGDDPQDYVDRYESDPAYREWFDEHYPGVTIREAVGLPPPSAAGQRRRRPRRRTGLPRSPPRRPRRPRRRPRSSQEEAA